MSDDDRDDDDRNVGCRRRRRRRAAVLPAASRGCRVSTWDGERRTLVGLRVDGGRRRRAPRAVAPRRVRATSSNISGSVCVGGGLEVVSPGPCVLVLAAPRLGGETGLMDLFGGNLLTAKSLLTSDHAKQCAKKS